MELMTDLNMVLAKSTTDGSEDHRELFSKAVPYKHVIIDNFFEEAFAKKLLEQFPRFNKQYALNEFGKVGGKAVISSLRNLDTAFQEADQFFSSRPFLDWLSELTGIPALEYDSENFGGGTHENVDGQDLLPHVDFNYHPATGYHRRLNLIVYLNPGWQESWGGAIAAHSNPRDPENDIVRKFNPDFNRCIIFETNEYSWHGFDRITLPPDQKKSSRKSLSLYFYTRERPASDVFPSHATFYVPRPLPDDFKPGRVLTQADVDLVASLLKSRDALIEMHQRNEADREGLAAALMGYAAEVEERTANLRLPFFGYVEQEGTVTGISPDRWMGPSASFSIRPARAVIGFLLQGNVPYEMPEDARLDITVGEATIFSEPLQRGAVSLMCMHRFKAEETFKLALHCSCAVNYVGLGTGTDERDLCFLIDRFVFEHDPVS